jgi:hypothetical protein
MTRWNREARLARASRLTRVKYLPADSFVNEGRWRKSRKRRLLIDRVADAIREAEDSGVIIDETPPKQVAKVVTKIMWGPILIRWVLAPLINHLIIYFWDKYIGENE